MLFFGNVDSIFLNETFIDFCEGDSFVNNNDYICSA